jgi:hypothetical protein
VQREVGEKGKEKKTWETNGTKKEIGFIGEKKQNLTEHRIALCAPHCVPLK